MRTALALIAAALLLSACGGICWQDHHGLDPPAHDSTIPAPHG